MQFFDRISKITLIWGNRLFVVEWALNNGQFLCVYACFSRNTSTNTRNVFTEPKTTGDAVYKIFDNVDCLEAFVFLKYEIFI